MLNIRTDSTTFDLYCTGVGKVFLAYMPEKELHTYLNGLSIRPRTEHTVKNVQELKRHIDKVRREGVAFDDEEYELGVRMVAAPVRDWDGNVIAAVGLLGPSVRITRKKLDEYAPAVKDCVDKISREMGFSHQS
jgi:DNA-binding IclR family transcriptional regulator